MAADIPAEHRLSLLFDVLVVSDRVGLLLAVGLEGSGLSAVEYGVYSLIREQEPVTPGELARLLGMPASTLSGHLATLSGRGHLRRRPSSEDRRSATVQLTAAGRRVHDRAMVGVAPAFRALEEELAVPVGDARAVLRELSRALAAATGRLREGW